MAKFNSIAKEILEEKTPRKTEMKKIDSEVKSFISELKEKAKNQKIRAEIFVGGSYAKGTMIKKDKYDIDIFLRYDKNEQNISEKTEKLLKIFSNVERIHGSRDYFRIKTGEDLILEIVPVKKTKNVKNAENITDLSYFHVKYINKNVKSQKTLDEIKLAKIFCYANNCYGAESYINGFSGYSLELLIYYYKSFMKFVRAMTKVKDKLIIDIEKHHKTKKNVLMDLNSAKLHSPIILIDPTFKSRNAAAALSNETFKKFQKACAEFLKKQNKEAFELKKTDLEKIKKDAEKNNFEFVLLEADTDKQSGDIAGSKLLKFYRHLDKEISEFFELKDKGFNYNKAQSARYYFVAKSKEKIILEGPRVDDKDNVINFRKKHNDIFTREGRIYARENVEGNAKEFFERWIKKHKNKIKEMSVTRLSFI